MQGVRDVVKEPTSCFESVKIHNDKIDLSNAVLFHFLLMLRIPSYCEKASMNFRVQCLHATIQYFWCAGIRSNISDRETSITECFGCPSS